MKREIFQGEYYHVLNRGNNKQLIFNDERDRIRLLFLILYHQSPQTFYNITRQINYYVRHRMFNISEEMINRILEERYVELVGFTLMPNHFHLILRELRTGGISRYMQRISNSHTKYSNTKNKTSGHLFQGSFKIVHIKDDNQLLYLSAYVHRNIREVEGWKNKEYLYPWSSYQDFIKENRWGEILKPNIILEQFSDKDKYKSFVSESGAKEKC
ncbi:transposase [Patescibacteria group bacterium]|nr:transposase [Patescibacteria group bacterium]